ncbi:MAG: polysaccharide pyruvyl transferase family protein [Eubacteriales bacterium]|nr:polysaccharide pyruvyl transferase family protein [Eubacteriales bacterium]
MTKIIMRAGMSPISNTSPFEVLTMNMIGTNIGNMLFPYSIFRTLKTEDTTIDTVTTNRYFSAKDIDRINQTYDYFVIPLANAFRRSFVDELNKLTDFIGKLRIPVIVTGVGTQTQNHDSESDQNLNQATVKFIKAVLKKSNLLGVRGEITAEYLKSLGFQEERDFTVIGCPSMFLYGKNLPIPEAKGLTPDSSVSINSKISLPQKFHNFMERSRQQIPDHTYVPQVLDEIYRMYLGMPYRSDFTSKRPKHFPIEATHEIYMQDKAQSFVNVPSWLQYLAQKDLSFGSRIHGNIAAILAGTPCYIFVSDARIKELTTYHNIPHMMIKDITPETNIDCYEHTDFAQIQIGHEQRFLHYLDFLQKNNLKTIYDTDPDRTTCPFDEQVAQISYEEPLHAFVTLSPEEQVKRLEPFLMHYSKLTAHKNRHSTNRLINNSGEMQFLEPRLSMKQKIKKFLCF